MSRSADPCKLRPQTVFSTRHSRQSRLILHWRSTGAEEQGRDMFCAVLAWSRVRFVRFGPDQTRTTTLELLAECFEELGGVPALVLTDRMSCLKAGVVANVVVPHPEYVAFATRFGFKPDCCEAADPESKGLVENWCGYAQTDLLIPALLEPERPNLEAWNVAARAWRASMIWLPTRLIHTASAPSQHREGFVVIHYLGGAWHLAPRGAQFPRSEDLPLADLLDRWANDIESAVCNVLASTAAKV